MRQQLMSQVSLLTEIKLKENIGKHKTTHVEINRVKVATPELMTHDWDLSAKVMKEDGAWD